MTFTIHRASAPVFVRGLTVLSTLLDKAAAFAEGRKIDPTLLVNARLFIDMRPLSSQIQIASDAAKGAVARLSATEVPSFPDTETTLDELKARIAKTIDYVKGVDPAAFDGAETREITLKVGPQELKMSGADFLFSFALPNFYFHVTTAYDILRHNGVEIGKRDFLGGI